ncbi:MAG: hypothetical protein LBF34_00910 [Puniceicoccales bacterium]|jgi:hypothetical protein|nr:hypothetical protein [Puniceicoccales bacterium]
MKENEIVVVKKALREWNGNGLISDDLFQQLSRSLNWLKEPSMSQKLMAFMGNERVYILLFCIIFFFIFLFISNPACRFIHEYSLAFWPFAVTPILGIMAYRFQAPQLWLLTLLSLALILLCLPRKNTIFGEIYAIFGTLGTIFVFLSIILRHFNNFKIFTTKTLWCGIFYLLFACVYPAFISNGHFGHHCCGFEIIPYISFLLYVTVTGAFTPLIFNIFKNLIQKTSWSRILYFFLALYCLAFILNGLRFEIADFFTTITLFGVLILSVI